MWRKAKQNGDSSSRSLLVRPCACVRFLPELIPLFHFFLHRRAGGQSEGDGEGASEWGTGKEKATPGRGVAAVGGTAAAQRAQARPHVRVVSPAFRAVSYPVAPRSCVTHEYHRCTWPAVHSPAFLPACLMTP
jgi:hypothetical protein